MATAFKSVPPGARYIIDDKANGVFKVNREAFTSTDVLEHERALIFDKSWLFLGHSSELRNPNDYLVRSVCSSSEHSAQLAA